jgi:rare lipoprotein A
MRCGAALVLLLVLGACHATKTGAPVPTRPHGEGGVMHAYATWYGNSPGQDGGPTASGETFHRNALTAAHRSLPFGTMLRVTVESTGRSVVVRVNDRGPYGKDRRRVLDLSEAAARRLGIIDAGVAAVTIEVLSRPHR